MAGRQLVGALSVDTSIAVKGFIDDDRSFHGSTINGLPVFGAIEIRAIIPSLKITDVLLAIPSASQGRRIEIIKSLSGCGARVRTMPNLHDISSGIARVSDLQELDVNDLLGRVVVPPDIALLEKNIRNKKVLVTGAGGSIGGELCRQIIKFLPQSLILIDSSEHSLYMIHEELKHLVKRLDIHDLSLNVGGEEGLAIEAKPLSLVPYLGSVRDTQLMARIFSTHRPNTVFHAAAYKHVPLVEQNSSEGIRNNVLGTLNCAKASLDAGVSHFTLVSTDKAVRPTNIMGASKRIAELVLQGLAHLHTNQGNKTCFSMVRFGNVLGSSGSVVPLFNSQIKAGSPISLTHPDVTRYFMTIPEAAQLVIQASAMATGGDVFVLDMGDPVRIYDLATRMIYLSGLTVKDENNPQGDIEIEITGLRPGEKLYEELLIGNNPKQTEHPKIMKAHEEFMPWHELEQELEGLNLALQEGNYDSIRKVLLRLVPGYLPELKV
jgi:FlaA1/EpsC-like NDP-sugar epimerase